MKTICWSAKEVEQLAKEIEYPAELSISVLRKSKNLSQNALMWKWNTEIVDFLKKRGEQYKSRDKNHVHEMHKHTFLGWKQRLYTNLENEKSFKCHILKSTKNLDKGEMQEFMTKIYHFWADKKLFLFVPELSEYFNNNEGENK